MRVLLFFINALWSISFLTSGLSACTKSTPQNDTEIPQPPPPKPPDTKEMKPENYPDLVWIYSSEQWKHETFNGGTAEYIWSNEKKTPEDLTLKVSTIKGSVCSNSWLSVTLKPNTVYRFSADIRTLGVTGDKGATITLMGEWWDTAEYVKGTQQKTNVSRTFLTDHLGVARLCVSLGINGQTSSGTVYFSNLKVAEADYIAQESKYMRLRISREHANSVKAGSIDAWLATMDRVYEQYIELVGANPYGQTKTNIYAPYPSIGAWGLAGNPIRVTLNGVVPMLRNFEDHNDWSFGMMHEIGHNFNSGDGKYNGSDANWNWNDEMFANFRLYYALDKLNGRFSNGGKYYDGAQAIQYFKTDGGDSYDNTIARGTYSHDAVMYTLIRLQNQIGWAPFEKAFREFYSKPNPNNVTNWKKFNIFLETLSKYAERDVKETYSEQELQVIKDNI